MTRETAVVVAPGRGTYGKPELGYLARWHADKAAFLAGVDAYRRDQGRTPVTELDAAETYAASKHASSVNASALIYACALADFASIDRDRFDIVAVTGNSLGWYLALAAGGALDESGAITLVDTMGALMETEGVGGQLIYPLVDPEWRPSAEMAARVADALEAANAAHGGEAYMSIRLGGMAVLAGNDAGLAALEEHLPQAEERFPFRLARHAAFHTPLLAHVARLAQERLPAALFRHPSAPLIDGRGVVWRPAGVGLEALHAYTLGRQITETYDFSKAIEVAVKEFAPDRLIVLGPGTTMGPPIAQELIKHRWKGLASKADFIARQRTDPFVLAMGVDGQRDRATGM